MTAIALFRKTFGCATSCTGTILWWLTTRITCRVHKFITGVDIAGAGLIPVRLVTPERVNTTAAGSIPQLLYAKKIVD